MKHGVYDADTHFIIDPVTRTLRDGPSAKSVLIQHDHNSERFTFRVPRFIEGHDMLLCNVIQVHYNNVEVRTKQQSRGVYSIDDACISSDNDEFITMSWLISHNATRYAGVLSFILHFSCVAEDGTVGYAWNTATYSSVSISSSIYNSEFIEEEYADVLEAWHQDLIAAKRAVLDVLPSLAEAFNEGHAAGAAQSKAECEAKDAVRLAAINAALSANGATAAETLDDVDEKIPEVHVDALSDINVALIECGVAKALSLYEVDERIIDVHNNGYTAGKASYMNGEEMEF